MKKDNKGSLSLSSRDAKILFIVLAVAILALSYFFGYRKFTEINAKYEKDITALKKTKQELTIQQANKDKYIADTATYNSHFKTVVDNYRTGTSEDASLDFLNNVELVTGTWISNTAFTEPTTLYTFKNTSGYKGVATALALSYEGKYDDWKELIDFINNSEYKNSIESVSMVWNSVEQKVSGTINITLYTITGADRDFTRPEFDLPLGTNNIFE